MIYFFIKNWKLLLDCLLVIALVLAFTFLDPFGLFMNTKTKATANLVTGVRDIGELITAEYYGEVISSWKEYKLTKFPADTLNARAEEMFLAFQTLIAGAQNQETAVSQVRSFKTSQEISDDIYHKFLAYLGDRLLKKKFSKIYDEKTERLKGNHENKIISEIFKIDERVKLNLSDSLFQVYLQQVPDFIYDFDDFYRSITAEHLQSGRKINRKNIVFIGRGWVKAGFRFDELNEENFLYDDDQNIIHFFGMKPEVLDADINPWFIPQQKVKGFELVKFNGNVNFEDAKAVKKQCKDKLLLQANKADIIAQAERNGAEALRQFFSLLLEEPDLRVSFHTNKFDHQLTLIAQDSTVDLREAKYIESIYNKEMHAIDSLPIDEQGIRAKHLARFISELKALNFIDARFKFNFYSMTAAKALTDSFHISDHKLSLIRRVRDSVRMTMELNAITTNTVDRHQVWFTNSSFQRDFNESLEAMTKLTEGIEVNYQISIDSLLFDSLGMLKINETVVNRVDTLSDQMVKIQIFKQYNLKDSLAYCFDFSQLKELDHAIELDSVALVQNQYYQTEKAITQIALKNYRKDQKTKKPIYALSASIRGAIDRIQKKKVW